MKYTMTKSENLFVKKDSDDTSLVLVKTSGRQVYFNRIGSFILDLFPQYSDTNQILEALKEKFPDQEERILKEDLLELLYILDLYDIVKIEEKEDNIIDESFYMGDVVSKVCIAGDPDYRSLSAFIINKGLTNKFQYCNVSFSEYYEPIILRQHTFSNQEYYCAAYDTNGEIVASMGVVPPNHRNNMAVLLISSLFVDEKLSETELAPIVIHMINRFAKKMAFEMTKIRVNDYNGIMDATRAFFESIGFQKESVLKKEMRDGDLTMYTMPLQ